MEVRTKEDLTQEVPGPVRVFQRHPMQTSAGYKSVVELEDDADSSSISATPPKGWRSRLAHPKTQIIIVSLVCFFCPGMFNALNSMNPPGLHNEALRYNQNTALYSTFAIFGLLAGGICNIAGPRVLLVVGGATYALYAGSYVGIALHNDDAAPFAIVAGGLLGLGGGSLWAAQGSMIMSYPTENRKGTYFAIFWSIFNLGGVLGSLISVVINWNNVSVGPSMSTYVAFIALMLCGSLVATLVVDPRSVVREDGTRVHLAEAPNVWRELAAIGRLFVDPRMLVLLIPFATSNWFYTYQFSPFQHAFSARTQGINNVLYWGLQMLGSYILGNLILDSPRHGRRRRAWIGTIVLTVSTAVVWTAGVVWEYRTVDPAAPPLDFVVDSGRWFPGFVLYAAYGLYDAVFQTFSYWVMGALTNDSLQLSRYAGFYKAVQCTFAAVSWQIGNVTTDSTVWLWITIVPCVVSCVLFAVVAKVWIRDTSEVVERE
eukprot:TRINITY_DN10222_c0_g1_i1.p1 TRINITY_DN10222_c0_g1~~TRINITY_DN10222_c0_g1_i1.p1  ORF type:complete len:493 (-),score=145.69 TRINITY_DN10222_c0_g1_i1:157-1614(-)